MADAGGWDAELAGRLCLVTGAGSGIGAAVARLLETVGGHVIATDLVEPPAGPSGRVRSMRLDVTKQADWHDVLGELAGPPDVLVNCAGAGTLGAVDELPVEAWEACLRVNLDGTFLGCKTVVAAQKAAGKGGAIVNISSLAAVVGGDDIAAYNAAKAGVVGLTKSVAARGARLDPIVRCNAVMPGFVNTPMLDRLGDAVGSRSRFLEELASRTPMRRLVEPEDVANLVLFLCSPLSRMITGAAIPIDGGILASGEPPTAVAARMVARARSA